MTPRVRQACDADLPAIRACDTAEGHQNEEHVAFLQRALASGGCFVAADAEDVLSGYAVLEYTFFANGFLSLLFVAPDHRRKGVGAALLRYAQSVCQTPKLFTSTNLSNLPMQALLAKSGYALSGVIHNLDENDPELVYFKPVSNDECRAWYDGDLHGQLTQGKE